VPEMTTNMDDTATSWRDLADQLTRQQISKLEAQEHGGAPEIVSDVAGWLLYLARNYASENLTGAVMFPDVRPPPGVTVYGWDLEDCTRDFEGATTTIAGADLVIEGRQYADGHCERSIMLIRSDNHGGMSSAQARQLAAALLDTADEFDRLSAIAPT
jgi:hypothetical protein